MELRVQIMEIWIIEVLLFSSVAQLRTIPRWILCNAVIVIIVIINCINTILQVSLSYSTANVYFQDSLCMVALQASSVATGMDTPIVDVELKSFAKDLRERHTCKLQAKHYILLTSLAHVCQLWIRATSNSRICTKSASLYYMHYYILKHCYW